MPAQWQPTFFAITTPCVRPGVTLPWDGDDLEHRATQGKGLLCELAECWPGCWGGWSATEQAFPQNHQETQRWIGRIDCPLTPARWAPLGPHTKFCPHALALAGGAWERQPAPRPGLVPVEPRPAAEPTTRSAGAVAPNSVQHHGLRATGKCLARDRCSEVAASRCYFSLSGPG